MKKEMLGEILTKEEHLLNRFPARMRSAMFGQLLVWATKLTGRLVDFQISGEDNIRDSIRQGRPIIFAGWHGHNFLTIFSFYAYLRRMFDSDGTIMVPESKNGLVLEYFAKKINLHVIKVKSELGPSQWARATVSMIKLIRSGHCALLSPDGPEGPAYHVKPGIAVIGQQTNALVIPASAASSRAIRLRKRWDEHLIPLPFSRTIVHFGTPIDTKPTDSPVPTAGELQERIKTALTEGALKADVLCRGLSAAKEGVR